MAKIILLNKPFHVLSQFSDDKGRDTLKRLLPNHPGMYPAGRLDYDSEGLLLLTNDGAMQHQISHPKQKLPKTYWVQVEGVPEVESLQALRAGITLNDGVCQPAKAHVIPEPVLWSRDPPVRLRKHIPTTWLEITITEGRNRQVRRMTAAIGHPTLRLVRVRIGNWSLGDLAPGQSSEQVIHVASKRTTKDRHTPKRRRRL